MATPQVAIRVFVRRALQQGRWGLRVPTGYK